MVFPKKGQNFSLEKSEKMAYIRAENTHFGWVVSNVLGDLR